MKQLSALLVLLWGTALYAQTTHDLHVLDNEFNPPTMTIQLGDHVHIIFDDADHTFTQVDEATWLANGIDPLPGGYNFGQDTPNPGTDFTITPTALGMIYYVCLNHVVDHEMKGTIDVVSTGVEEATMQEAYALAPNPASDRIELLTGEQVATRVLFFDATGRRCLQVEATGRRIIDLGELPSGQYTAEIRDQRGTLLSRQQLVVAR